jgi:opacity protein-like surface antigen
MKNYAILFLMGFLLASFSIASASGLKGKIALTGNGGLCLPMGDFGAEGDFTDKERGSAESGFGFGGSFEVFVTDNVSIGANFTYQELGMKTDNFEEQFEALFEPAYPYFPGLTLTAESADGEHKITSFGVFGKYLVIASPQVSPYLKFGFGAGKLKPSNDISGSVIYQDTLYSFDASVYRDLGFRPYVDIGGGILYQLTENIALTAEGLYSHFMTSGTDGDVFMELTLSRGGLSDTEKVKFKEEKLDYNADCFSASVGLTFLFGGKK